MLGLRTACSSRSRAAVGLLAHRTPLACSSLRQYSTRPKEPFKILFCGSDEFSVAILKELLLAEDTWQTISVLTPPERQVGRGGKQLYVPPLKAFAHDAALITHTVPTTGLKGEDYTWPRPFLTPHGAHLLVTASFGHIIPSRLLDPFTHTLNVHPSVLPRYRGAAPVQWAIANRDPTTGVSVQTVGKREVGVDSGHILGAVEDVPIPDHATYDTLLPELSELGGKLLVQVLRRMIADEVVPRPQDSAAATRAPKITSDMSRVDWTLPAASIEARNRAWGEHTRLWSQVDTPTRGSITFQLGDLGLASTDTLPGWMAKFPDPEPATAFLDKRNKRILVATGDGFVQVKSVIPAAKTRMEVTNWFLALDKDAAAKGWTKFV